MPQHRPISCMPTVKRGRDIKTPFGPDTGWVRTIGWITFLVACLLLMFLATLSVRGNAWIAELAALVDLHTPLDGLQYFIG